MKIAIVTGASSGIGKAAALRLSARGMQVLAGVRKEADASSFAGLKNIQPFFVDVTKDESVAAGLQSIKPILEKAEQVHLVNNAGIAVTGPVEGVPLARWREQYEVNVFGLVRATQTFLPFIRSTRGRVVNMSSISGLATSPFFGPYSSSKFAVEAISDALRREISRYGCKVVVIEPGAIATPIWDKGLDKKDDFFGELSPEMKKVYGPELQQMQKGVAKIARDAAPVDLVSDAVEKALLLARPRTRYVVGPKALAFQMAMLNFIPDAWADKMISSRFD